MNKLLNKLKQQAISSRHRLLVVVSGEQAWGQSVVNEYLSTEPGLDNLCISDQQTFNCKTVTQDNARQYLGNEFDHVIYDAFSGFFPNVFAIIEGTLKGGGLFFLLIPDLDQWPFYNDSFSDKYAMYPYKAEDMHAYFIQRLVHLIGDDDRVSIISQSKASRMSTYTVSEPQATDTIPAPYKTLSQKMAVEKILHTANGHRNRPLVLLSNRGHGKSTALGIACTKLMSDSDCHITVTGPRKQAVKQIFDHISGMIQVTRKSESCLIDYKHSRVEFIAPDELIRNPVKTSILMIDEAAALPLPMLEALMLNYHRIVLSSTVYGYEGNGRGFELRFLKHLEKDYPGWSSYHLDEPVRWNVNDPLETFCYQAFLMDSDLLPVTVTNNNEKQSLEFYQLDKSTLMDNESLLKQIFGLLTSAHYKTTPNDLRMIVDSPYISIFYLKKQQQLVACALVSTEGSIESHLSEEILKGNRRISGQLLPQTVISEHALIECAQMSYARIMRIAVNPTMQSQGIGSLLLTNIHRQLKDTHDFIGASYGGNESLFRFWEKAGYSPIKAGHKRNAYSGYHSLVVIKGLSENAKTIVDAILENFPERLLYLLTDSLKNLDASLVYVLLKHFAQDIAAPLTAKEKLDLESFANSHRSFDTCASSIYKSLLVYLNNPMNNKLSDSEWKILAQRVIQRQDVSSVVLNNQLQGKEELLLSLRRATLLLVNALDKDSITSH